MRNSTLLKALSFTVLASLVLVACGGGTAPIEAAYDEIPYEEPLVLDSGGCDYGGKIERIEALDEFTVQFTMCSSDPAFPQKAAFTPFGVQPREYLDFTGGTGDMIERPVGTGPYYLAEWARGESITFQRFEDYWGEPAIADTVIFRWATEGAARLLELQSGEADQITNIGPDDFDTVKSDPNLQFIPVPNPNTFYIAFNNNFAPWDDVEVRKAVALGIDRQRIVDNFYPDGSEVASHFTPCSIPNGCAGEAWFDTDIEAANAMLDDLGFPRDDNGVRFTTSIFYRDVFRGYLPEPGNVAVDIQAQLLENLGIEAEVVVMESGEFITESQAGRLDGLHLLGWGADYPHVTNFLDFHFGRNNTQFGQSYSEIYEHLEEGNQIGDVAVAEPIYELANNAIRDVLPMIPVAHGVSAQAAQAGMTTHARPFGAILAAHIDPGKETFVFVQNAEPLGLWCADETDGESLAPCEQVVESLLAYALDSGDVLPSLATACTGNDDSTVWTCTLREGVRFHDGSSLDANDVVASWAAGLDAENPNHVGRDGTFFYFGYLFDSLINPPPSE